MKNYELVIENDYIKLYDSDKKLVKNVVIALSDNGNFFKKLRKFVESNERGFAKRIYRSNNITYSYLFNLTNPNSDMKNNAASLFYLISYSHHLRYFLTKYKIARIHNFSKHKEIVDVLIAEILNKRTENKSMKLSFIKLKLGYLSFVSFQIILKWFKRIFFFWKKPKVNGKVLFINPGWEFYNNKLKDSNYANLFHLLDTKKVEYTNLYYLSLYDLRGKPKKIIKFILSYLLEDKNFWITDFYDIKKFFKIVTTKNDFKIKGSDNDLFYEGINLTDYLKNKNQEFEKFWLLIISDYIDTISKVNDIGFKKVVISSETDFFGSFFGQLENKHFELIAFCREIIDEYLWAFLNLKYSQMKVDKKLSWSPYYTSILKKVFGYSENQIWEIGDPRIHLITHTKKTDKENYTNIVFLSQYTPHITSKFLEFAKIANKSGLKLYFKKHPSEKYIKLPSYITILSDNSFLNDTSFNICVTWSSTLGIEALAHGKIVYFFNSDVKFHNYFPPRENLDKVLVSSPRDLYNKIMALPKNNGIEERKEIDKLLKEIIGYDRKKVDYYQKSFIDLLTK